MGQLSNTRPSRSRDTTHRPALSEAAITATGNSLYFVHTDHLGSVSAVTCGNSGGCPGGFAIRAVVGRQYYRPYGGPRGAAVALPTDRAFTGQYRDATGLDYFRARYFSSSLGRFISADSIVPGAGNPQNLNRYAYVRNSPLKLVDPSGHFTREAIETYLINQYGKKDAAELLKAWEADAQWWAMLTEAMAGDVLYGRDAGGGFLYTFLGEGRSQLWALQRLRASKINASYTLLDLFRGFQAQGHQVRQIKWSGIYRSRDASGRPVFPRTAQRYPVNWTQPSLYENLAVVIGSSAVTAVGSGLTTAGIATAASAPAGPVVAPLVGLITFLAGAAYLEF